MISLVVQRVCIVQLLIICCVTLIQGEVKRKEVVLGQRIKEMDKEELTAYEKEIDDELEANTPDVSRPFYAKVDDASDNYKNKHDFGALHLEEGVKPTMAELIDTCLRERQSEFIIFEQGMWVEYRSNDMRWKVGRVNRVIEQPPDDWDFDEEGEDPPQDRMEISYNIGVEGVVYEDNIRAAEAGLQAVFGKRPWLFQQFMLLQLEKRLRFDAAHEYDFEQIDNLKFATKRYDAWLNAPENEDFKKLHDKQPEITQKLLKTHLLTPFDLCDFIVERKDEWNFNDPDISVYTYAGVLGAGLFTLTAVMGVQLFIPLILLYNNIVLSDGGASPRFEVTEIIDEEVDDVDIFVNNGNFLPFTNFDQFCSTDRDVFRYEGKVLLTLVIIIYLLSVVPDAALGFYRTSGGYFSTYSKINSLRQIIWEQQDDDIPQEIGYKVDRIMNTGYICLLYTLMLFVLLNTPLVLDIILNALAIEFIHRIDEVIADADWWDEGNRWIKAGTIELVIQATLRLRILESAQKICSEYDIDRKDYVAAVGGMQSLMNSNLARRDEKDERHMTDIERVFESVAREAESADDGYVLEEYRKKTVQFGIINKILGYFGKRKGLFKRYPEYRVWSRWEKVLFLPRLPSPDFDVGPNNKAKSSQVQLGKTDLREFREHVLSVLTFGELLSTLKTCVKNTNYTRIPLKVFIGLIEWFLYIVTLFFPFIVFGALFAVPLCY